jgi:hypothetical protein
MEADDETNRSIQAVIDSGRAMAIRPDFAAKHYVSDNLFFASLGFTRVISIDYSDFEGADVIHDLNRPGLSEKLGTAVDLVIDAGTAEHVFHFPNLLDNIFNILTVGGHVIHSLPVHNQVDHGFYQFSPTLFFDYYSANKWQINHCYLIQLGKDHAIVDNPWVLFQYKPGCLDQLSNGGFDDKIYAIIFCAKKTTESTTGVIPYQNYYRKVWGEKN